MSAHMRVRVAGFARGVVHRRQQPAVAGARGHPAPGTAHALASHEVARLSLSHTSVMPGLLSARGIPEVVHQGLQSCAALPPCRVAVALPLHHPLSALGCACGAQKYSKAADVFSFAVVLWELAVWQLPWEDLGPFQARSPMLCRQAPVVLAAVWCLARRILAFCRQGMSNNIAVGLSEGSWNI